MLITPSIYFQNLNWDFNRRVTVRYGDPKVSLAFLHCEVSTTPIPKDGSVRAYLVLCVNNRILNIAQKILWRGGKTPHIHQSHFLESTF